MKVIIKYKKIDRLKYISHLDTLRLLQRALRRANINIIYSEGYNPHPKFSFAMPLSLGIETYGDYVEVEVDDGEDYKTIKDRLNCVLPDNFKVVDVELSEYSKTLSARLKNVVYIIDIRNEIENPSKTKKIIEEFFREEQIVERVKKKKRKTKVKKFDSRKFIEKIDIINKDGEGIKLKVYGIFSNEGTVKMEELVELLKKLTLDIKDYKIIREDMIFER
jgi:radical SAM-linked protein